MSATKIKTNEKKRKLNDEDASEIRNTDCSETAPKAATAVPSTINGNPTTPISGLTELRLNDVLLGRGAHVNRFEGNIRYRNMIRDKKNEYSTANKRRIKDMISREIVATITSKDGRFLRPIDSASAKTGAAKESTNEGDSVASPEGEAKGESTVTASNEQWVVVSIETAVEKTKQALRDLDFAARSPKNHRRKTIHNNEASRIAEPVNQMHERSPILSSNAMTEFGQQVGNQEHDAKASNDGQQFRHAPQESSSSPAKKVKQSPNQILDAHLSSKGSTDTDSSTKQDEASSLLLKQTGPSLNMFGDHVQRFGLRGDGLSYVTQFNRTSSAFPSPSDLEASFQQRILMLQREQALSDANLHHMLLRRIQNSFDQHQLQQQQRHQLMYPLLHPSPPPISASQRLQLLQNLGIMSHNTSDGSNLESVLATLLNRGTAQYPASTTSMLETMRGTERSMQNGFTNDTSGLLRSLLGGNVSNFSSVSPSQPDTASSMHFARGRNLELPSNGLHPGLSSFSSTVATNTQNFDADSARIHEILQARFNARIDNAAATPLPHHGESKVDNNTHLDRLRESKKRNRNAMP